MNRAIAFCVVTGLALMSAIGVAQAHQQTQTSAQLKCPEPLDPSMGCFVGRLGVFELGTNGLPFRPCANASPYPYFMKLWFRA